MKSIIERVEERAQCCMAERGLANPETPVLLMVSGGSDSTALAYIARELAHQNAIGQLALLHVNHQLRGEAANKDAQFVEQLAQLLEIPCFLCEIDVAGEARRTGENVEAVARHERYLAAHEALESLCRHACAPLSAGRIFTAHSADDRVENFYMRSIVGTGPGGFRSMRYLNGGIARPLLDCSRDELRVYIEERAAKGMPVASDNEGNLWREDATNAHTDRFRAYVRHHMVPAAKERNPQALEVLCRTMNLIADEDDMLEEMVDVLEADVVSWVEQLEGREPDYDAGFVLLPQLIQAPRPLQRRLVIRLLHVLLGQEERIDTASVESILQAWNEDEIQSGYVTNIQGDLAVSANKRGVRVEPMTLFRARRKRDR